MLRRGLIQIAAATWPSAFSGVAQSFPAKPIKLVIAFPGGWPHRHHHAPAGRQRLQDPRPAGDRGEQAGRRRHAAGPALQRRRPTATRSAQIPLGVFRLPYTTKIDWDPVKDISYVINLTGYAFGIVVPADSPIKNWKDFVAYAKANPGKLSYGSTGTLTSPHLTTELIAQKLGIQLITFPTRAAPNPPGHRRRPPHGGRRFHRLRAAGESGKLRVLNTWGEKRLDKFPDAPRLKELGLDIVQNSPFGSARPLGIPRPRWSSAA